MDRKSTGSYLLLFNGGAVTWKSYKQKCTARSLTEKEYIALSKSILELGYLRKAMDELGVDTDKTVECKDN